MYEPVDDIASPYESRIYEP